MTAAAQTLLPRWRGFNLQGMFGCQSTGDWPENDFRWIRDWGFDFVRLPLCYLLWTHRQDPHSRTIDEPVLERLDRAVELGGECGLHVCLNFHRAPGYTVNRERAEPFDLWHDDEALDACCFHWTLLAERYQGIDSRDLSFNLFNEPPAPARSGMTRRDHERVVRAVTAAVREVDADRLILIDGLAWGNEPCKELADLGVAQSCRAYAPMGVSHYMADWVGGEAFPPPQWPGGWHGETTWGRAELEAHYRPWIELARGGVGVHCGEGGAFRRTPHAVVLAWLRDVLEVLTAANIGYALWNFRGSFGVLDSGRDDVDYEDFHGHALDRKLLELLQEF